MDRLPHFRQSQSYSLISKYIITDQIASFQSTFCNQNHHGSQFKAILLYLGCFLAFLVRVH